MREIKFRGKCINEDAWAYGSLIQRSGRSFIFEEGVHVPQCKIGEFLTEVIPESVGEFTGLKDKNGREIFEGDVIYWEIDNGVGIESYSAVVRWSENLVEEGWNQTYKWLVGYTGDYYRGSYDELSTPAAYNGGLRVIGNIYENPELIKGVNA